MYDETTSSGRHIYTVAQIAKEFGVTRPTIYRHLDNDTQASGRRPHCVHS
jgi:predicted transcriptional regulator